MVTDMEEARLHLGQAKEFLAETTEVAFRVPDEIWIFMRGTLIFTQTFRSASNKFIPATLWPYKLRTVIRSTSI